jgi:glutathione synthase/RimK-type ligase-like ATP-grasp enzyme
LPAPTAFRFDDAALFDLTDGRSRETACRAAQLIGDGLYGVDIKQVGNRIMVIEVNDNPNVETGIEDAALGMELYRRVARSFRRRIEQARA